MSDDPFMDDDESQQTQSNAEAAQRRIDADKRKLQKQLEEAQAKIAAFELREKTTQSKAAFEVAGLPSQLADLYVQVGADKPPVEWASQFGFAPKAEEPAEEPKPDVPDFVPTTQGAAPVNNKVDTAGLSQLIRSGRTGEARQLIEQGRVDYAEKPGGY